MGSGYTLTPRGTSRQPMADGRARRQAEKCSGRYRQIRQLVASIAAAQGQKQMDPRTAPGALRRRYAWLNCTMVLEATPHPHHLYFLHFLFAISLSFPCLSRLPLYSSHPPALPLSYSNNAPPAASSRLPYHSLLDLGGRAHCRCRCGFPRHTDADSVQERQQASADLSYRHAQSRGIERPAHTPAGVYLLAALFSYGPHQSLSCNKPTSTRKLCVCWPSHFSRSQQTFHVLLCLEEQALGAACK